MKGMCDKRFMFYHTGNDMIQDFMKRNYRKFRNITCALIVGISVAGSANIVYADMRPGSCDDAIDVLRENGLLEEAIANGAVSPEAAAREGLTGGASAAASSTPTEASSDSGGSVAPATTGCFFWNSSNDNFETGKEKDRSSHYRIGSIGQICNDYRSGSV